MFSVTPALFLLLASAPVPPPPDDIPSQVKRFADAYAVIEREAADPVSADTAIFQGAIPGMLRRLDPHSVFFDPQQFDQLKEMENSTRKGFGSIVSVLPGRVFILQAVQGTPAAKSGLAPGDEILAINKIPLAVLHKEQLVALLGESRQKQARLDVRRPGNARILQFMLTPEELQAPSVDRRFHLKPDIGYLRASSFDADTGKQIQAAIEKLGGEKLKGLVLDLRDNPGGLLPAALETASLFLKPSQKILTVRGRSVQSKDESVGKEGARYNFSLAVLINGKSASASEIVAGALQDHDRAVIVGEPSFGKGLVESVYPLSQGTGLALTTAYYYTPSGRSIQKPLSVGQIQPSNILRRTEPQREYRTDSGRTVRGGGGIQPDYEVYPEPMTRFRVALEASGSLTSFASEYTRGGAKVSDSFEVTPELLDRFQVYLSEHNIRPGVSEWSSERAWISSRLKSEIVTQALGVERGDQVEAQRDPVILTALDKLAGPPQATVQAQSSPRSGSPLPQHRR